MIEKYLLRKIFQPFECLFFAAIGVLSSLSLFFTEYPADSLFVALRIKKGHGVSEKQAKHFELKVREAIRDSGGVLDVPIPDISIVGTLSREAGKGERPFAKFHFHFTIHDVLNCALVTSSLTNMQIGHDRVQVQRLLEEMAVHFPPFLYVWEKNPPRVVVLSPLAFSGLRKRRRPRAAAANQKGAG